ncbi:unnamed protein product [Meloidogyne enterolobii]|uniref:Uncharacterized protein n=1 Tax=Meloidogyne enterolobii TaxID=390850 RepID=A0ACB0ZA01_MELEN
MPSLTNIFFSNFLNIHHDRFHNPCHNYVLHHIPFGILTHNYVHLGHLYFLNAVLRYDHLDVHVPHFDQVVILVCGIANNSRVS